MLNQEKLLQKIAFSFVPGIGTATGRYLLETFGSVENFFDQKKKDLKNIEGFPAKLVAELDQLSLYLKKAEQEIAFAQNNGIEILFIEDDLYPSRLKECPDAPLVLYYKGTANLSATKIISIVGTRHATAEGKKNCDLLIEELSRHYPHLLVVSGLALGIDIQAHRSALKHRLPTVGVLAHGLDNIYPADHRNIAKEMLSNGGLLTEYPIDTTPFGANFVRRNRIVAGLSDATIVIESASKGGSLITADIASSYHREVFAFPGRVSDPASMGCNQLIRDNKASIITSASDLMSGLGWHRNSGQSGSLYQEEDLSALDDLSQQILQHLREQGSLSVDMLAIATNIPAYQLLGKMIELEIEGKIRLLQGGLYEIGRSGKKRKS